MAAGETPTPPPDDLQLKVQEKGGDTVISVRLERPAAYCYQRFCQVDEVPTWLWVVGGAVVHTRDELGRALEVDFMGQLERASVGYALSYAYDDGKMTVSWSNRKSSGAVKAMSGSAHFIPDGPDACRLRYTLTSQLSGTLPAWDDRLYQNRPAEAVVLDFCEWLDRSEDERGAFQEKLDDTLEI